MISAIYPGSFDPITLGHEDVILRSSKLVDKLFVSPLSSSYKKNVFTIDERINHLKKITSHLNNVEILGFTGLLADFVLENKIDFIIKGVRNPLDFEQEFQMATAISILDERVETLFIPSRVKYLPISSSMVRDLASCKGKLDNFVPKEIIEDIERKYQY